MHAAFGRRPASVTASVRNSKLSMHWACLLLEATFDKMREGK